MAGIFGESLLISISNETKHGNFSKFGKSRSKIRGKFREEKKNIYQYQSPSFFLKRPCNGKKRPVPMNLPLFTVEAYVPGGGVQNQAENKIEKCLPVGTGTKFYFPSMSQRKTQRCTSQICVTRDRKNHDSQRRDRILRFLLKNIQWRRRPEIADFCPLSWPNAS